MTGLSDSELNSRMRAAFEGSFLDATDIKARGEITLEISELIPPGIEKDAKGKLIDKAIVAFKGAQKRLILNKTNAKIMAMQLTGPPSEWKGQKVTLTVRYLPEAFGQRNVPVVRVKPQDESQLTFPMRKKYGNATPGQ